MSPPFWLRLVASWQRAIDPGGALGPWGSRDPAGVYDAVRGPRSELLDLFPVEHVDQGFAQAETVVDGHALWSVELQNIRHGVSELATAIELIANLLDPLL